MDIMDKLNQLASEGSDQTDSTETPVEETNQAPSPEEDTSFKDNLEEVAAAPDETEEVIEETLQAAPEEETTVVEEEQVEESGETPTPTDYEPNFKYKAVGQEFEFDDEIKSIIKDKETEEKYRSIFAKAKGLEFYEEKHKRLEDSHAKLSVEYEDRMTDARELASVVHNFTENIKSENPGDQHRALLDAGVTDQKILDIARHVLELKKLDPTQRQAYDNQFAQKTQLGNYEAQLQSQSEEITRIKQETAKNNYFNFMANHKDIEKEFESREGVNPGDFTLQFIQYGNQLEERMGKELDLGTVLEQFKKIYHLGNKVQTQVPVDTTPKRTIPNLRSSGESPMQRGFKNMDDLRSYMDTI